MDFSVLPNQDEYYREGNFEVSDTAWELLQGATDIHVHSTPTQDNGFVLDDFELVEEYEQGGLAGVCIKCHDFGSFFRSQIAQKYAVKGNAFKVYGSLVLSYQVGGFNPCAVESAINAGAKQIYMPTLDSANNFQIWDTTICYPQSSPEVAGMPMKTLQGKPGLYALDEEGNLLPEIYEILELVRDANIVIASGHLSNREARAIFRAAKDMGVKKMVHQHIDWRTSLMSIGMQREWAEMGVKMEKSFYEFNAERSLTSFAPAVGTKPSDYVMSSDQGMFPSLRALRGYACNVQEHLNGGVSPESLHVMLHEVPEFLMEG